MDRSDTGRRSKQRGKADERYVNKVLGGTGRYPADTGGLLDVEHEVFAIQVKGGKQPARALREGLEQAQRAGAVGKLACVVIVDRTGPSPKRYIAFDLHEFADHEGYGHE